METKMTHKSYQTDPEAREALWHAVLKAADRLSGQCTAYVSLTPGKPVRVDSRMQLPEVPAWRLVEALSLLAILLRADKVITGEIFNLLGKTGPLHFVEDGHNRFLWAQPSISGEESALGGRPDLIVTSSSGSPTAASLLRVVECKCRNDIGTHEVRGEFGKAHDLRVTSYLIWSYNTPKLRIVEGAKRLGLDLCALGFDTPQRESFIADPENLVAHVANTMHVSKTEQRFGKLFLAAEKEITAKMLTY